MIHLTRLNNEPLIVNAELIKFIEHTPDTVLTLVTGEKIVVLESAHQVLERIVQFRRELITVLGTQTCLVCPVPVRKQREGEQ